MFICFLSIKPDLHTVSDPLGPFWVHFHLISFLKQQLDMPEEKFKGCVPAWPPTQIQATPGFFELSLGSMCSNRVQWFVAEGNTPMSLRQVIQPLTFTVSVYTHSHTFYLTCLTNENRRQRLRRDLYCVWKPG